MRVEQQNTNIVDVLQQSIGPEEREGTISAQQLYAQNEIGFENIKAEKAGSAKSVNLKDATYLKPENEAQKSTVENMEESSALDAATRKEQMVVLSNTTSEEDYARMQEEGFSLDETTSNTIVTETDKIKALLAKAGVDISFFGDDLDIEQLEAIAGSPELAMQLAQAFKEADVPCSEENMKDAMEAISRAESLQAPGDGTIKYLLDNGLEPTIENIYKAEYSGNYQMSGDALLDLDSVMSQVEKIIHQAGLPVNDETKAASLWLLQNDVSLNEENLKYYEALINMELPVNIQKMIDSIATAVAEGKRPQDAMLIDGYTLHEQAEEAMRVVTEATDADLTYLIKHGMDMSIQNISYAMASRAQTGETTDEVDTAIAQAAAEIEGSGAADRSAVTDVDSIGSVAAENSIAETYSKEGLALLTARRQLEEVRLAMSVQANYSLLKKGFEIDIVSLEKLVEELKTEENAYYENLLRTQGAEVSEENVQIFRNTTEVVSELKTVPAYVLGIKDVSTARVGAVHEAGMEMQSTFEKAHERYETLMTAPRADLGDSIQKAFGNIEDILADLGLEATEENERAVRILGYNEIEITEETIVRMKAVDEEVQRAFRNMTPATVTEMIKRGINPLDMDFTSLNNIAEEIRKEQGTEDDRKFSEYLWKLEKSNEITQEERASFIGTYRLIHQVEKTDGAAIGALMQQGAEVTMRNLMMAVRSERRSGRMDYSVDDSFRSAENTGYKGTSITAQIETSYQNNCLKDMTDILTPDKLKAVMEQTTDWENMTPEQLKAALAQAETDDAQLDYEYAKEQLAELSQSAKVTEDVYRVLDKYDIPNTMSNILAMESMVKNRNGMFRQIFGSGVKDADEEVGTADLEEIKEELLKEFGESVSSPKEMAEAQEKLGVLAENVMKGMIESDGVTSLDVREMRLLSTQLSINSLLAKEEQYSVPVMVNDGVVNVSLKIVRGVDKKGVVDVMMESELRGKIAATFQAKEQGVTGLIATDNQETKALLDAQGEWLSESLGEEENAELHYACISDLDLNQFSMGTFGVDAENSETTDPESGTYQVQTSRLYHIAESFIQQIREVL